MAFEDGAFPFAPSSTKLPAGLEFLQGSHASSTNAAWLRTTLNLHCQLLCGEESRTWKRRVGKLNICSNKNVGMFLR
jgi:hypothetical protein